MASAILGLGRPTGVPVGYLLGKMCLWGGRTFRSHKWSQEGSWSRLFAEAVSCAICRLADLAVSTDEIFKNARAQDRVSRIAHGRTTRW
ncbi:hypothetical protein PCASD_14405 [Puccinia coronata f. sp. avenae]|uniref:Uncharacterized protein n=1 Tax=Puccinia coronata f. sp. avenae TaxID=200324 RepID=A0A2N5T453_9BASI|nr:hypothetical protein PCASD_19734 [Puccinia coronata f. sp. avenae]PLW33489.1 hypothetical protein PCASD_14405 [Puccinia coronata f. sp. avenae]